MIKLLLGLLPSKYKAYLNLVMRLFNNLNTLDEVKNAISEFDGYIGSGGVMTVVEWTKWGKTIGIFRSQKD